MNTQNFNTAELLIKINEQAKLIEKMQIQIKEQNELIDNLKKSIDTLLETKESKLENLFNSDQLRALDSIYGAVGHKWSSKTIMESFQVLYMCGIRGYNFLRHKQPWPSLTTLKARIQNLKFQEGILYEVFAFFKIKAAEMGNFEKHCGIVFDEMAIAPGRKYDQATDAFVGSLSEDKALVFV